MIFFLKKETGGSILENMFYMASSLYNYQWGLKKMKLLFDVMSISGGSHSLTTFII